MSTVALNHDQWMAAVCVWREARGTHADAMLGVLWVIINRAKHPRRKFYGGPNMADVVLQPKQFSCFNPKDPNAAKLPGSADLQFGPITDLVASPGLADPTFGATHYYSDPIATIPSWVDPSKHTVDILPFHFYKLD